MDKDAGQKGHFIQKLWELAARWAPTSDLSRVRHSSVTLPWSESNGQRHRGRERQEGKGEGEGDEALFY